MCDYSLMHVKSRAAEVGDKLVSTSFAGTITHGFSSAQDPEIAVCLLPGTELAFGAPVKTRFRTLVEKVFAKLKTPNAKIATFTQVHKDNLFTHHDALEFVDGSIVMVHNMEIGQTATVLQMPAKAAKGDLVVTDERLQIVA